jgi:hypothetical protein
MEIEKYLDNELSAAEKEQFEQQLKNDKALNEEVELQKALRKTLQQMALREKVQRNFSELKAKQHKPQRQIYRIAATFLGLCFVIGIIYWATQGKTDNPTAGTPQIENSIHQDSFEAKQPTKTWHEAETPTPAKQLAEVKTKHSNEPESSIRGGQAGATNEFSNIVKQYLLASQAIDYYKSIDAQDSVAIRKGIAALTNQKPDEAGRFFLSVREESSAYPIVQWFFALSLLERQRIESAKSILVEIERQSNHPFQKEATKLLLELKD